MAPPILALRDIYLTFGGTPLLTGAELSVEAGDRICLVGRNGSGKSTLLKIAAGLIEPDRGERFLHPNARARYLPQEVDFSGFDTTLAYVEAGLGPQDDPHIARMLLADLGLTGDEDPARLSGGEARRAALARTLAPRPDILLLDEPTNHLDLAAIEWLEAELMASRAAIVLISHDRRFLENLSRATIWLDRGRTRRQEQGFATFEAWRDEVPSRRSWRRTSSIAKSRPRAAVDARRRHRAAQTQGRVACAAGADAQREARGAQGGRNGGDDRLRGPPCRASSSPRRSGSRSRSTTRRWIKDLSLRLMRGDRLGLVGPNGAGKTTLLKMLIGELAPDSGAVRLGANLELVQLDQRRDELNPSWTVTEAMTGGKSDKVTVNGQTRHVASYMKDFLFQPEQARSPVSVLSGGERARLLLARVLAKPSNVLVLDEPTNDLDLETLDLLQELIDDYPGTVLLVSHDRDFLDRIVTSVVAPEGDGRWIEYAGGYSDMLAQRKAAALATTRKSVETKTGPAAAIAAPPEPRPAKRRLSFKEKHALETLPATIDQLSADIARLQARLAAPDLFAKDPVAFNVAAAELESAELALAAAEEQWLELELLREELAG